MGVGWLLIACATPFGVDGGYGMNIQVCVASQPFNNEFLIISSPSQLFMGSPTIPRQLCASTIDNFELAENGFDHRTNSTSKTFLLEPAHPLSCATARIRTPPRPLWRFGDGWWGPELIAWFFSALSFGAIIVILVLYDNHPFPDWLFSINTVISTLAQVGQTALMVPAAACIDQLKWVWYSDNSQPLADFEFFNSAARGPWGSLLLILETRARYV